MTLKHGMLSAIALMVIGLPAMGPPLATASDPGVTRVAAPPTASSLAYPQSLFVDSPNGNIWVADFDHNRVLRFDVSSLTGVVEEPMARSFVLSQNYPNPFNPGTTITFSLPATEYATVIVYDLLGREVATLFRGTATAGTRYVLTLDATGLASGMYFYSLRSAGRSEVRKMSVLR